MPQKNYRAHVLRTQWHTVRTSATVLQKLLRGRQQRDIYKEMREEHKRQQQLEYQLVMLKKKLEVSDIGDHANDAHHDYNFFLLLYCTTISPGYRI
jgi:hypothetical protein